MEGRRQKALFSASRKVGIDEVTRVAGASGM